LYGSGFPKSHDVSKAIDKAAGAEREVLRLRTDGNKGGGANTYDDDAYVWDKTFAETAPATDAAKQWQGWGTALKPAWEPFILARKPLDGTVAANVLTYGTGGINVDGCRVGTGDDLSRSLTPAKGWKNSSVLNGSINDDWKKGRWPANVIHDGSDTVDFMGKSARFFYTAKASRSEREAGLDGMEERNTLRYGEKAQGSLPQQTPSKPTKQANHHPTVKPTALMQYLCKLITPPDGTILDPFCGSGSTGVAAIREGFNFIGIELNPEYAEIAKRRIEHERNRMPLLEAIR